MMKKLMFIFVLAAICSLSFSQRYIWIDTLDLTEIAGSDTIVFAADSTEFPMFGGQWSFDIEYSSLNDDDATVSVGGDNRGNGWNALNDTDYPFTLDVTSNTAAVNGTNRTSQLFYGYYYPFITVGYKIDPGSVTSGSVIIKWISNK